jgi:4-amino-4-deoxy-L-arabinose transferase-like glycosyltransferase
MVAWLILATSFLGKSPLGLRFLFVLCEGAAALLAGATATRLSGDRGAGTAATIAFLFIPQIRFAIGEALPDPPYLFFWALALYSAVVIASAVERRERSRRTGAIIALGVALGGALLTRIFGWALVFGIIASTHAPSMRTLRRRGLWLSMLVALALYVPLLVYDAGHGWQNLRFTLSDRGQLAAAHPHAGATAAFLVLLAVYAAVAYAVTVRMRYPLLAWTALPMPVALALMAPAAKVETYWLLGPLASVCVGIGIAFVRWKPGMQKIVSAIYFTAAAYVALLAVMTTHPAWARVAGYAGVYAFEPLARDVRELTEAKDAAALTDRYETESELRYYGVPAMLVGGDAHVRQWRRWHASAAPPATALLVVPGDADIAADERFLLHAYRSVRRGPVLHPQADGMPVGTFLTVWCSARRRDAAATLWHVR